ncbi:MAG TPA: serine hydrolase [Patescibacteria group bacterium]
MKKILIAGFIFILILISVAPKTWAEDTTIPTLSDAVYADLALKGYLDNISVSFYDGKKSEDIKINDTRHWLPASTVKLFVAMYAYKQIADSKLDIHESISIDAKNVVPTEYVSDELPIIQEGDYLTIERLLKQMITQSDNTAYNVLLDVLDRNKINDYVHSLGLTHTSIGSKLNLDTSQEQYEFDVPGYGINTTTAEDYNQAFIMIWRNKIADAKPLFELLKQQKINYMLPLLLPKGVVVAHKHGDLDPLFHDGGIVIGPKNSYALSIFTNAGDPNLVAHISEIIYTRDFSLVGKTAQSKIIKNASSEFPPLDPLLAQGKIESHVLAANTNIISTQPITAADLGITASDLALTQTTVNLPKIIIPADSYWHGFVNVWQALKVANIFNPKSVAKGYIDQMRWQIAESKDLLKRGKSTEANILLNDTQNKLAILAKAKTVQNDASIQIALQGVSEARFNILKETLNNTSGQNRNALIRVIGQQAKNTLSQVQPNLPLATNATNPTQRPLIGEVVDKTDTQIVVKTAGGQQLTIPLDDQTLTVKTKQIAPQITPTTPTPVESGLTPSTEVTTTITPTTPEKTSLADVAIGTSLAMVGSSTNGNVFTPIFVLTNVPKELSAPEPVEVVKVNKTNRTMVISENGVPVQVNVGDNTIIKGKDTSINFNEIKSGDVVVVHGEPLVPVKPIITPTTATTVTGKPTAASIGTMTPTGKSTLTPTSGVTPGGTRVQPTATSTTKISISPSLGVTVVPSVKPVGSTGAKVTSIPQVTTSTKQVVPQAPVRVQTQVQPKVQPQAQPQPKVIQSTSIQVIQKSENRASAPPPAPPQPQAQPKPENKPQPPAQEQPKSPPPAQTNPAPETKATDKKK